MLTNEEVIEEMLTLAKQIAAAQKEGDQLGLRGVDEVKQEAAHKEVAKVREDKAR